MFRFIHGWTDRFEAASGLVKYSGKTVLGNSIQIRILNTSKEIFPHSVWTTVDV